MLGYELFTGHAQGDGDNNKKLAHSPVVFEANEKATQNLMTKYKKKFQYYCVGDFGDRSMGPFEKLVNLYGYLQC